MNEFIDSGMLKIFLINDSLEEAIEGVSNQPTFIDYGLRDLDTLETDDTSLEYDQLVKQWKAFSWRIESFTGSEMSISLEFD